MNRREWIGATAGMLVSLPNGVSVAKGLWTPDEPCIVGTHPMHIQAGSDNYFLDWFKCYQEEGDDTWYWSWREKTNSDAWFAGQCMTREPQIDVLGGHLRISVADGIVFHWTGGPG